MPTDEDLLEHYRATTTACVATLRRIRQKIRQGESPTKLLAQLDVEIREIDNLKACGTRTPDNWLAVRR